MSFSKLCWPDETINPPLNQWASPLSNICLDFHGNPNRAGLCIFSDGNHHTALLQSCRDFKQQLPELNDVFIVTAPPAVILKLYQTGTIAIGNLQLDLSADVFISPPQVISKLHQLTTQQSNQLPTAITFAKSSHHSFLISTRLNQQLHSVKDIFNNEIRLAISNPETETFSYQVYLHSLQQLASLNHFDSAQLTPRFVYSQQIHHREVPELVASDRADAALLYHHLALSYLQRFPDQFFLLDYRSEFPGIDQQTEYQAQLLNNDNPFASRFIQHLQSDNVQDIYKQHGLLTKGRR